MSDAQPALDGHTIVVTGAAGGVGRALVRLYSDAGGTVVAVDQDLDDLQSAIEGLPGVLPIAVDLSTRGFVDEVIGACDGRVDILVNNAGAFEIMDAVDLSDEVWDAILAVNLTAPFLMSRAVIPPMISAGGGRILNVSSVSGIRGGRAGAAYTASKHGLIGLTTNVAVTYAAEGIRCNAICPGGIQTAFSAGAPASDRMVAIAKGNPDVPRERYATADQIAAVAFFLTLPASSHVNGAVIPVDNGWTAI